MTHVKINIARTFKPHVLILNAAQRAYKCGQENPEEAWWSWLDTLVYCSLSIEAIGNTYGETLIPDWKSFFETASPLAKIRLVAEHCGLKADFSSSPYSILRDLIRFRNSFAHAKPENIETEKYCREEECEKHLYEKPISKLEGLVTEQFAKKSIDAICDVLAQFAGALPTRTVIELQFDDWSGGATYGVTPPAKKQKGKTTNEMIR